MVGGIPHFERTMGRRRGQRQAALRDRGGSAASLVDMHRDESDDPLSRHIETLAFETQRLGLHGRVTGSHCTSMHLMDNYYVSKLLPLIAESQVSVVANPLINITLQGRHDTYPKRRGMTRARAIGRRRQRRLRPRLRDGPVVQPSAPATCSRSLTWARHVAQMTSQSAMRQCFDAVTNERRESDAPARLRA